MIKRRDFLPKNKFEWFYFILMLFSLFVWIVVLGFISIIVKWAIFGLIINALGIIFGVIGIISLYFSFYVQKKNEKSNNIFRQEAGFYYKLTAELANPLIRVRRYQTYLEDDTNTLIKENCEEINKYLEFILNATKACNVKYVNLLNISGKSPRDQKIIITANLFSDYYLWREEQNLTWRVGDFGSWFINKFDDSTKKAFMVANNTISSSKWESNMENMQCNIRGNDGRDFYYIDFKEYMEQIFQNLNSSSTFYLVPSMMHHIEK